MAESGEGSGQRAEGEEVGECERVPQMLKCGPQKNAELKCVFWHFSQKDGTNCERFYFFQDRWPKNRRTLGKKWDELQLQWHCRWENENRGSSEESE